MKSEKEIKSLINKPLKSIEKELGIKIRNGGTSSGIKKALKWVVECKY